MSPVVAMPAAAAIMFCSAIPKLKERSGNLAANMVVFMDLETSASKDTTSGFVPPSASRASA